MQQRQPRLGDILDDYCPRERRLTNHVVVAMIGDEIKQTRCTTCEAEHEYKQAKVPPQRKKKEAAGGLFQDVLNGGGLPRRPVPAAAPAPVPGPADTAPTPGEPIVMAAAPADDSSDAPPAADEPEGPVHRQLIRATLPRHEGQQKDQRPIPEFTIRAATKPAGHFRHGRRGGAGMPGGNSERGNSFNFRGRRGNGMAATGHASQGNRARPAQGERHGQSRRRGGKKRSK